MIGARGRSFCSILRAGSLCEGPRAQDLETDDSLREELATPGNLSVCIRNAGIEHVIFSEILAVGVLAGDHEARRALFGAVEAALQALDLRDEGALAAADGLLADLRRLGALSAWQLDRLCDTLEVQLELDSVMGSAARASYEQLPPVRAERAGDHRLADLLDAEYSAMHAEEQLLGTAC
ncbi:unnamed protein product [Prorocentrum cordatum]|nr:unnamed protein product [Polarella glacialis]